MNQYKLPKSYQKPILSPILPFTLMPVRRLFPPEQSSRPRDILLTRPENNISNKNNIPQRQEDRTPDI